MEHTRIGKGPEDRGLHVHLPGEVRKGVDLLRTHGQGHPLLGLGEQDLPGFEAGVLERGLLQVELAAAVTGGHLADGGRKAAGAVVGDGSGRDPRSLAIRRKSVIFFWVIGSPI